MKQISPEDHMYLLKRAWEDGIDRRATRIFMSLNMLKLLKEYTDAGRSDEFVRGFACAMKGIEKLWDECMTFKEAAEKWEDYRNEKPDK